MKLKIILGGIILLIAGVAIGYFACGGYCGKNSSYCPKSTAMCQRQKADCPSCIAGTCTKHQKMECHKKDSIGTNEQSSDPHHQY